jgi:hypothetical protein
VIGSGLSTLQDSGIELIAAEGVEARQRGRAWLRGS